MSLDTRIAPADSLPVVRYHVECGGVIWRLRELELEETLGRPYRGTLLLITDETDLELDALVGADVTLECIRGDAHRVFKGVVDAVDHLGDVAGHARIRIHLVPVLAWLGRTRGSRIFQDASVPEILRTVLEPVLGARNRALDLKALDTRAFARRDYCVQYDESILDFVHRLLEEEGLTYRFETISDGGETMVVTAENEHFAEFAGRDGGPEVLLVGGNMAAEVERVDTFAWSRRARAPRVVRRGWDWRPHPPQLYEATAESSREVTGALDACPVLEVYEHSVQRMQSAEVGTHAQRTQQALSLREASGIGTSDVVGVSPGYVFELVHNDRSERVLLTRVVHRGDAPEAEIVGAGTSVVAAPSYHNRIQCVPADVPYRMERTTPRPTIVGVQTAVVTGPEGEEIYTDAHGRIKVRMHWDRSGTPPEEASCWIRVAQMWSGPGWGTMVVPRVGMEVLVTFIEGNPDRPLCTGCVYHGGHPTPYPLPDSKTKSTIRSSSSPAGRGANELTFEDAAGAEEVFLQAHKDLRERIGDGHSTSVGGDRSITVGGNRSETITGTHTVTVHGANADTSADGPHYAVSVEGDHRLSATNAVELRADARLTLRCKSTLLELTEDRIVLQAGEHGSRVVLDIEALIRSHADGVVHLDRHGSVVTRSRDAATLTLSDEVVLESQPGSRVHLDAGAHMGAPGADAGTGASLSLTADAQMVGQAVALTSQGASMSLTTAASLVAQESTVVRGATTSCLGEAVTVKGTTVDVLGDTMVTVRAPLATIN